MADAEARATTMTVRCASRPSRSRDAASDRRGLPIFSRSLLARPRLRGLDARAAARLRPLQGRRASSRAASSSSSACAITGAADLPVNVGQNNFDRDPLRIFPRSAGRLRGIQDRRLHIPTRNTPPRDLGDGLRLPGGARRPRQARDAARTATPSGTQGWYFNIRREPFRDPRVREAIGLASISSGRTRTSCSAPTSAPPRSSRTPTMKATGKPSAGGTRAPRAVPRQGCRPRFSASPSLPPVSDGSGQDRALLRRADDLLRAGRLQARRRHAQAARAASRSRSSSSIPSRRCSRTRSRSSQNLGRLGIKAATPHRRCRAVSDAASTSSTSTSSSTALRRLDRRRARSCATSSARQAAKTPGSRNIAGIADPAVDALIEQDRRRRDRATS